MVFAGCAYAVRLRRGRGRAEPGSFSAGLGAPAKSAAFFIVNLGRLRGGLRLPRVPAVRILMVIQLPELVDAADSPTVPHIPQVHTLADIEYESRSVDRQALPTGMPHAVVHDAI